MIEPIDAPFESQYVPGERAHLTKRERALLWVLHCNAPAPAPHKRLYAIAYQGRPDHLPANHYTVMRIMMTRLRKKLTRHDIVNVRGVGYQLMEKP